MKLSRDGIDAMHRFDDFIDLLKTLIREPSVVGAEHAFFRVLQRELEERGPQVTWYEGLLVAQGSRPHSRFLSAHIDRHGLMCTGPNEFQYAAFVAGNRSDLLGNSVSEALVRRVVDRFNDTPLTAYEPWSGVYRGSGRIVDSRVCEFRNNLIFNVDGLDHLVAGTPVAFRDRLTLSDGMISGQLDNVLTAAVLVHLYDLGYQGTAFFTAEEESGKSWRYLLEWFRRFGGSTNQLIVVDTSPYPDRAAADAQHVVLRRCDANAQFNTETTTALENLCRDMNISYGYKDEFIRDRSAEPGANGSRPLLLGSTEMGRITAASKGLVHGTTLQVPTTGYHTMQETASRDAVESFLKVLHAAVS